MHRDSLSLSFLFLPIGRVYSYSWCEHYKHISLWSWNINNSIISCSTWLHSVSVKLIAPPSKSWLHLIAHITWTEFKLISQWYKSQLIDPSQSKKSRRVNSQWSLNDPRCLFSTDPRVRWLRWVQHRIKLCILLTMTDQPGSIIMIKKGITRALLHNYY